MWQRHPGQGAHDNNFTDATPLVSNMSAIWICPAACFIMNDGLSRVILTASACTAAKQHAPSHQRAHSKAVPAGCAKRSPPPPA